MDILLNQSKLGPEKEKFVQFTSVEEEINSNKTLQLSL